MRDSLTDQEFRGWNSEDDSGEMGGIGDDLETIWRPPMKDTSRTNADAWHYRRLASLDPGLKTRLRRLGFHPEPPFSVNHPFGEILDAVGPDLLHQISKCFHDYMLDWIWKATVSHWQDKFNENQLKQELDSRFALMPSFAGLKSFPEGIFTQSHHGTVHELKEQMRVILGALAGLCPVEALSAAREYLHIHRLAHYNCHTDESLQWLDSAIETFFKQLRAPGGIFVRKNIVTPDYEPPRLHYLFHYVRAVIMKGALPSFSTDRTEIWHKGPKSLYSDSGKHHWMPFVLKGMTVAEAFHNKISYFQTQRSGEDGENTAVNGDPNGDPDSSDESSEDDDINNPPADVNSLENIWRQNGDATSNTVDDVGDINGQTIMETTQSMIPKHTYIWPKPRGYRRKRALEAETEYKLLGLNTSLERFFSQSNDFYDPNALLWIPYSIQMTYPTWLETEVGMETVNNNGQRFPEEHVFEEERHLKVERRRINTNKVRHEIVFVKAPDRVPRGTIHAMSFRRVAQVLLLFKYRPSGALLEESTLAYVNWFETKRTADKHTGLYLVSRTTRCAVIDIADIERPVHLIPKYGSAVGETYRVKQQLDAVLNGLNKHDNLADGEPKYRMTEQVMRHYKEFWLNTWIDHHLYKTVF